MSQASNRGANTEIVDNSAECNTTELQVCILSHILIATQSRLALFLPALASLLSDPTCMMKFGCKEIRGVTNRIPSVILDPVYPV